MVRPNGINPGEVHDIEIPGGTIGIGFVPCGIWVELAAEKKGTEQEALMRRSAVRPTLEADARRHAERAIQAWTEDPDRVATERTPTVDEYAELLVTAHLLDGDPEFARVVNRVSREQVRWTVRRWQIADVAPPELEPAQFMGETYHVLTVASLNRLEAAGLLAVCGLAVIAYWSATADEKKRLRSCASPAAATAGTAIGAPGTAPIA